MLEDSLMRIADQLEKEDSLRRQIKSAMVYPGVVLTFALTVLIGLVTFLVPVFVGVFETFDGELPTITKFTVALSNAMKGYWWAFILGTAGAVWLFRKWKSTYRGRGQWDAFRLRIPMQIGDIVQKVALARWSRTLSALVSAGVPLLAALDITAKTAGNRVIENAMTEVIESVKRGGTIADPLKAASVFPGMVSHMVGVGEETGALDAMLVQDRRLLRGPGRRGRQVADLDPRAGHARGRRRHRRVRRDLDVHAAVQGLRLDQVAHRSPWRPLIRYG